MPLRATNALTFCLTTVIGSVLFFTPYTRDVAGLFFGGSMLVAAVRGDAGCEVTAISNWVLRRDDQVACVIFSPIDAAEARLRRTWSRGA